SRAVPGRRRRVRLPGAPGLRGGPGGERRPVRLAPGPDRPRDEPEARRPRPDPGPDPRDVPPRRPPRGAATPRCGPGGARRMSDSSVSTSTTGTVDGHPVDVEAPVSRPISEAVVSIRQVQYDYGSGESRTRVLFDVDLDIGRGEVVIMT